MSAGVGDDAGVGISVGGQNIANWLIGKVRHAASTENKVLGPYHSAGAPKMVNNSCNISAMSHEHFDQIARLLATLVDQLSTSAYRNFLQARYITRHKQADKEKKAGRSGRSNHAKRR